MAFILNNKRVAGVGVPGKSAFEIAEEGGYQGTEEQFIGELGKLEEVVTEERVGEIVEEHNEDVQSHFDIRQEVSNVASAASTAQSIADTHIANTSNPHGVTAAQVGAPTVEEMNAAIEAIPKSEGYTKEETLSAETKELYGMDEEGTPDEAFSILALIQGVYAFHITVTLPDDTPIPNAKLNGVFMTDRVTTPITDANGKCLVVSESDSPVISINNYIGIVDKEEQITIKEGSLVTPIHIIVEEDNGVRLIQTSNTYPILYNRNVDLCAVGAGASGFGYAVSNRSNGGAGGGGGYVEQVYNVIFPKNYNFITIEIGSGGASTSSAVHNAGGSTTIKYNETILVSADGAIGQEGNGNGGVGGAAGNSANGTDGLVRVFNDSTLPLPGGGGGGGSYSSFSSSEYATFRTGGKDFGGRGASASTWKTGSGYAYNGGSGSGPGGGGGGGARGYWSSDKSYNTCPSGKGGDGGLYVRVNAGEVSA